MIDFVHLDAIGARFSLIRNEVADARQPWYCSITWSGGSAYAQGSTALKALSRAYKQMLVEVPA